nr:hypothetical protein [Sphingobium sp. CECT 9361]
MFARSGIASLPSGPHAAAYTHSISRRIRCERLREGQSHSVGTLQGCCQNGGIKIDARNPYTPAAKTGQEGAILATDIENIKHFEFACQFVDQFRFTVIWPQRLQRRSHSVKTSPQW